MILGGDGNLYGTTVAGGVNDDGTVFKITTAGVLTKIYDFVPPGYNTGGLGDEDVFEYASALIQGSDGNFYGTTRRRCLQLTAPCSSLRPPAFTRRCTPSPGRTGMPRRRWFRATTATSTAPPANPLRPGLGTVFQLTPAGVLTTLHVFTGLDGGTPDGVALTRGADGNFYGTTAAGGTNNRGSIFQITPAGVFASLYSFTALDRSTLQPRRCESHRPSAGHRRGLLRLDRSMEARLGSVRFSASP